ncbi:SDR family oxidoreductase [Azospirillum sp. TSO35-2]|uniref:NAD-dependent epimerase/dehydratase family protein n=1 Tax=Azospirillum sp. TSO35-2 TaxID=716796 RepID=UPI000D60772B|nr:SDR family oxidoreductase [Azospirillum sp. TSO35-2]PWC40461.1 hypothetical protein TSO352_01125 [Azospirillum sp. TSO35-2]
MTCALLSGASGYLGGICADWLKRRGWSVLTAGRSAGSDCPFDFDRPYPVPAAPAGQPKIDLFVHFAAANEVICREDPLRAYRINVLGTQAALEFCRNNGIGTFIYVSTRHVFGAAGGTVTEEDVPDPIGHYGLSHLLAEKAVQAVPGLRGRVLRPGNIYGMPVDVDRCDRWSLVPLGFCREAVTTGRIRLNTPGTQPINFVSGASVAHLIEGFEALPPVMHAVGPTTLSVREFAGLVRDVMRDRFGRTITVEAPPVPDTAGPYPLLFASRYGTVEIDGPLEDYVASMCSVLCSASSDAGDSPAI